MLPIFQPDCLSDNLPGNFIFLGNRKSGKSFMCAELLKHLSSEFDLVISFLGTKFCNDNLSRFIAEEYTSQLNFTEFNSGVLNCLWSQQERLLSTGTVRRCAVIFDDVFTNSKQDSEALTRLFFRGRHHKITCFFCCVSYSACPKPLRRCADCIFLFSALSSSDRKYLTEEYIRSSSRTAMYCLENLQEFECLVIPTWGQQQKLFRFKIESQPQTSPVEFDNEVVRLSCEEPELHRSQTTASPSSDSESEE
jgi:hypothetical protein